MPVLLWGERRGETRFRSRVLGRWTAGLDSRACWLIDVTEKDGKPNLTVLSAGLPNFANPKIEGVRGDAKSFHFNASAGGMDFQVAAYVTKEEPSPRSWSGLSPTVPSARWCCS